VTVSLNAETGLLSPGEYMDNVVFSNVSSTASQRRGVELTVLERVLDHFEWAPIPSTQYVGEPFGVTVKAVDPSGSIYSNFTGTVSLYAPKGIASQQDVLDGTTDWGFPMHTFYEDARTQVIYLNSELGASGLLTSLSLYVSDAPGQTMNAWTIRLKHTLLSGYSSDTRRWETNDWIVVLQTNMAIQSTGWVKFDFTTPFVYNGTDNLLVDFSYNNNTWSSSGNCWSTSVSTNRSLYYRTDSGFGDPLTWSGTTPFGTITNTVPAMRIDRIDLVPIAPQETGPFVNGVWTGNLTVSECGSNVVLIAQSPTGHQAQSNPIDVLERLIGLPQALDNETVAWTTAGAADWRGRVVVTHDGVDAAQSGAIDNREASWLETQVSGPGDASFWWRVSSEADWDWLEFYVDGVLADRITGETGWLHKVQALTAGMHTLRWRYVKDGADIDPVGQDCGWVDQFTGPTQGGLFSDWLLQYGLPTNGSADYSDTDGDGMNNWEEWIAGTVPTNGLSLLQLEDVTPAGGAGDFRVRWQSVPGKRYWVGSCDALTYPIFFTPFVSNVLGEAGSTEVLDARPSASGTRFYRVGVQQD